MSENNAPQTPWATEPDKRGPLRAALILGVIAVVLLAVLGGCALLGRDSGKDKTKGPTKSADQIAAEKAAEDFAVANAAQDPSWCDLTTHPMWAEVAMTGVSNEVSHKTCVDHFGDLEKADAETIHVDSVRSISLTPVYPDKFGVELDFTDADTTQHVWAYQMVKDTDGRWKVEDTGLIRTGDHVSTTPVPGVDVIAVALDVDTREGAQ